MAPARVVPRGLKQQRVGQDQRDVVPVDPDSRLPRAVLESLGAIDPSVDGWGSEVLSSAVGAVLHEFEAGLVSGVLTGLELHATEGFSSSATLVAGALEALPVEPVRDLDDVTQADEAARRHVRDEVARATGGAADPQTTTSGPSRLK